jgi:hypothetical protein
MSCYFTVSFCSPPHAHSGVHTTLLLETVEWTSRWAIGAPQWRLQNITIQCINSCLKGSNWTVGSMSSVEVVDCTMLQTYVSGQPMVSVDDILCVDVIVRIAQRCVIFVRLRPITGPVYFLFFFTLRPLRVLLFEPFELCSPLSSPSGCLSGLPFW